MTDFDDWDDGTFFGTPHVPWKEIGEIEVPITVDLSGDGSVRYRDLVIGQIPVDSADPRASARIVAREWIDKQWDRAAHPWDFH